MTGRSIEVASQLEMLSNFTTEQPITDPEEFLIRLGLPTEGADNDRAQATVAGHAKNIAGILSSLDATDEVETSGRLHFADLPGLKTSTDEVE